MTDLTAQQLISCFGQSDRTRLQKVVDTGVYEWVLDYHSNYFQATFADTCLQLTAMDDRDIVFHASFDVVKEAFLANDSGNLLELHNAGEA